MNILALLVLLAVTGGVVHITRFWPRVASVLILIGGGLLVGLTQGASLSSLDIVGVTLGLESSTRDLLTVAFGMTVFLALVSVMPRDRAGVSFLFWPWIPWVVALTVNDFVVAVFGWMLGMVVCVLAMKPRKYQRTSGAANFLVLIVIATASLLLASRLLVLYPLTPERTELILLAVLLLAWGMGVYFGIFPFHLWVAPVADDTPLPNLATLLGLGQPIGLWLLVRLLSQYPWILDKSDMLSLFSLGGAAAVLTGGLMAAVERREGRLLGYAAIFSFGFVLINVGQASREGLAYAGFEIFQRGIALAILAVALTIAAQVSSRWVQRAALLAFILAGLDLVGLRLGVSFAGRWNVLVDWAGSNLPLSFLALFAHAGLLVGLVRFARRWHLSLAPRAESISVVELETPIARNESVPVAAAVQVGETGVTSQEPVAGSSESAESGNGSAPKQNVPAPGVMDKADGNGSGPTAMADLNENENNSTIDGQDVRAEAGSEEYAFEAHLSELVQTMAVRLGPTVQRLAHSLPGQTRATLSGVWQSWRVWMSIGILVLLIGLLFIIRLEPGFWFNRILESLGAPPLCNKTRPEGFRNPSGQFHSPASWIILLNAVRSLSASGISGGRGGPP